MEKVVNLHLLKSNPKISMKEVENSFGGNICRCTGYRPILDAFKSLASDSYEPISDIEDITCPKNGQMDVNDGACPKICGLNDYCAINLGLNLPDGRSWYQPTNFQEIFEILDMEDGKSCRFVAGNTGQGVYRMTNIPDVFIDVNVVPELHGSMITDSGITLGANISLTETMELFYKLAKESPARFAYCETLADHIDLIANVPVRNTGTLAGNIALKRDHPEFPSDIFLLLETVGAQLVIDSGVHGALVVLEPSLNGDTMATALGIPPSRNMIRRHLTDELETLVLPARTGLEGGFRNTRRSAAGSLGRIQSRALPPPPPIQEHSPDKDRRPPFRGSLSRALGLRGERREANSPVQEAVSPTSSESSYGGGRPESPQSAIVRRRPTHRHRRVKSIGDIDAITITPV